MRFNIVDLMRDAISNSLVGIFISGISYVTLFYFNDWLTAHISYGIGVSWIYLPAGLRLFLTLIFGLPGAVGISVGSFLISYFGDFSQELTTCIGIGLVSGFAPYLARLFVVSNVQIAPDLNNLSIGKLLACILIYAALSAGLHQWWFALRGLEEAGTFNHVLVMFFGDVAGSLLLIVLVKFALDIFKASKRALIK
uniref:hypothetical protein n=1 Tax=Polynucleobacter sp. TaxID=2029855 RepID=UPI00404710D0